MKIRKTRLGMHDGTLCIIEETPQQDKPLKVATYWPTGTNPYDLARVFGIEIGQLEGLPIKPVFPGTYIAINPSRHGVYEVEIRLRDGLQTKPIHHELLPIDPPKVGKGTKVEYEDGYWYKCSPKGKWTRCEYELV